VINHLGDLDPFFSEGTARSKRAQLGMAQGEPATGGHCGKENLAEALVVPFPVE
jgi:hypothetical protein